MNIRQWTINIYRSEEFAFPKTNDLQVLVKQSSKWYGELDVSGFILLTQEEWLRYKEKVLGNEYISFDVGYNKNMFYDNPIHFLKEITITEITDEKANAITNTIGKSFGFTEFYADAVEL